MRLLKDHVHPDSGRTRVSVDADGILFAGDPSGFRQTGDSEDEFGAEP